MAKGQLRVDELWAFLATDPTDNTEGIISVQTNQGHMPLVGADLARMESLRPLARDVGDRTGAQITLARFTVRTDLPA